MEAHEAHEVGDHIAEGAHGPEHEVHAFRRLAGVILGVIAMLLAIASLLGEAATKETVNFNILASDAFAFYQAKNERQTALQLANAELNALLTSHPDWPNAGRDAVEKLVRQNEATISRYESDPASGEGKRELLAKARRYEQQRDGAQRRDLNYDYARAIFQIAIVLGSVSIVGSSRWLLLLGCVLAAAASLLTLNGLLLLVPLGLE